MVCKIKGCNNRICKNTARYGSGLCRSCASSGKNNGFFGKGKGIKKYYCISCGQEVSDYRCKRCVECAKLVMKTFKEREKRRLLNINKNNPSYKNGKYTEESKNNHFCVDCGKKISINSKRCKKCYHKYIISEKILKGRKKSKAWRKKISETSRKRGISKGKNNPMFGKVTHGKWGKYKDINMRSSYEIAYAKYLDKNKIKWQYEPKAFDLGNSTYTPDFYLPKENLYIEIKGYWRDNAKKKFNSFKKKYKDTKIKVLMKCDLEKLEVI
jgi:hypothetical protein